MSYFTAFAYATCKFDEVSMIRETVKQVYQNYHFQVSGKGA